jgi:hypothetical protein
MRLRPKDEDDGSFWMPWDEFVGAGFTKIDICDRTTKSDLRLRVEEDMGPVGIVWGALSGLARFFCLCHGAYVIYFGRYSSERTKSSKRGCTQCCEVDVAEPTTRTGVQNV